MTQVHATPTVPVGRDQLPPPGPPLARWTVARFEAFIEGGLLEEGDAVELLDGLIVEKMPITPPHAYAVKVLYDHLLEAVSGQKLVVNAQAPIALSDASRPEPDLYVAAGSRSDYRLRLPEARELRLLVEVANSSIRTDRGSKLALYAEAGIPEYWIVDVNASRVECYIGPDAAGSYRAKQTYGVGETIEHEVFGRIEAGELFGE